MTGARRGAPAARVAAVLVLTVLVGGCGSAGDQVVEEAAQRAGEAAGVQDVQVDREAGSITVDTEQGTVTTDVSTIENSAGSRAFTTSRFEDSSM